MDIIELNARFQELFEKAQHAESSLITRENYVMIIGTYEAMISTLMTRYDDGLTSEIIEDMFKFAMERIKL